MTQEENFNEKCKKKPKKTKQRNLSIFTQQENKKSVNQCTQRCPGRTSLTQSRMSKKFRHKNKCINLMIKSEDQKSPF